MNKVDLDALEALEKAADHSPWETYSRRDQDGFDVRWGVYGLDPYMPGKIDIMYYRKPIQNCELIAAMRNALPAMIAELRAAREVIHTARVPYKAKYDDGGDHDYVYGLLRHALDKYDEAVRSELFR